MKAVLVAAAVENQQRAPVCVCAAESRHASTVRGPAAGIVAYDFDVMNELDATDIMSGKTKADQVRDLPFHASPSLDAWRFCHRLFIPSRR